MKNYTKSIIAIAALLLSTSALAGGVVRVNNIVVGTDATNIDNNGNKAAASITGETCTLTITPASSYYITVDNLSAIKTIDGSNAQTRDPGFNSPVTISATDPTADPSKETTYTFAVTDDNYDYEITAEFQTRTSIETADAEVTVAAGPFTYSGEAIKPEVTVTLGDKKLISETDYKAFYADSINAGTGKITIVGIRTYTGSKTNIEYTIDKANISPVVSITGWTYGSYSAETNQPSVTDGNPGKGEVTYKYKEATAETYSDGVPVNVGSYTVQATVAATANFNEGIGTANFSITPKSIADATISFDSENFVFNGQDQKPKVTVKDGETPLTLNTDYTITNEESINVGKYTVTITGKGNYDATTTTNKNFNITALEVTPAVVLTNPVESIVYDGTEKSPAVTVSVIITTGADATELTSDDYDVAYSNNVNAGENTAKATVTLKGNYTGTNTANFTIVPKSIAEVSVVDILDQTYTGDDITPTVTVKDGDKTLTLNTDYTVSYGNNKNASTSGSETAPTVTITGKGNYDPQTSVVKKFTIIQAAGSISYKETSVEKDYGAENFIHPLTKTGDGAVTYESSTPSVATIDATTGEVTVISSGQTTITATVTDGTNYTYATKTATYTITVGNRTATVDELGFKEGKTTATYFNTSESLFLPEGVIAYIITGTSDTSVLTKRISYIPQNEAVLIEKGTSTETAIDEIGDNINLLYGTTEATPVNSLTADGGTVFVLYDNEFIKTTSGTIPANKAYLLISEIPAGTRSLSIGHDDGTTGIKATPNEGSVEDGDAWYDLLGHKIEKPTKPGLYIKGGKKVVINK